MHIDQVMWGAIEKAIISRFELLVDNMQQKNSL